MSNSELKAAIAFLVLLGMLVVAGFKVRELDGRVKELERHRTATAYWLPDDRYIPGIDMDEHDRLMRVQRGFHPLPSPRDEAKQAKFRAECPHGNPENRFMECPLRRGGHLNSTAPMRDMPFEGAR